MHVQVAAVDIIERRTSMQNILNSQAAMAVASILCGVALLYLVLSRTLKRRAAEREENEVAAD